jgi:hypothetical protein
MAIKNPPKRDGILRFSALAEIRLATLRIAKPFQVSGLFDARF